MTKIIIKYSGPIKYAAPTTILEWDEDLQILIQKGSELRILFTGSTYNNNNWKEKHSGKIKTQDSEGEK